MYAHVIDLPPPGQVNRKYQTSALVTLTTPEGLNSYTPEQVDEFAQLLGSSCTKVLLNFNPDMNSGIYSYGQKPDAYREKYAEFA